MRYFPSRHNGEEDKLYMPKQELCMTDYSVVEFKKYYKSNTYR